MVQNGGLFESGGVFMRVADRLKLYGRAVFKGARLAETIVPIISVDDILKDPKTETKQLSLTGTAYVAAFTVPAGERWHLRAITREATTGSAQAAFQTSDLGSGTFELAAAGTGANYITTLDILLEEGDSVGMIGGGNAGDGSRTFRAHYVIEKLKV